MRGLFHLLDAPTSVEAVPVEERNNYGVHRPAHLSLHVHLDDVTVTGSAVEWLALADKIRDAVAAAEAPSPPLFEAVALLLVELPDDGLVQVHDPSGSEW